MYIEAVYILRKLVQARRCGALDLLVERARGRGPEPARHGVGDAAALPAAVLFFSCFLCRVAVKIKHETLMHRPLLTVNWA